MEQSTSFGRERISTSTSQLSPSIHTTDQNTLANDLAVSSFRKSIIFVLQAAVEKLKRNPTKIKPTRRESFLRHSRGNPLTNTFTSIAMRFFNGATLFAFIAMLFRV